MHKTVEMEEQMTTGHMKEAFMVMRDSEKCRNPFFAVFPPQKRVRCQMNLKGGSYKQKSSYDG